MSVLQPVGKLPFRVRFPGAQGRNLFRPNALLVLGSDALGFISLRLSLDAMTWFIDNGLESTEEARHLAWKPGTQRIFVEALGSLILGLPGPHSKKGY